MAPDNRLLTDANQLRSCDICGKPVERRSTCGRRPSVHANCVRERRRWRNLVHQRDFRQRAMWTTETVKELMSQCPPDYQQLSETLVAQLRILLRGPFIANEMA